ncbi:hypothetical telomeric sfiI 20 protein 3 [Streptomyces laurentii]|uniref:Hypothetical telomeric sfiI 20 protein 3 n=1 Tax=Streptomyces laurentii TaxID=39478 RepID=A0A169NK61_STRLU|nr:hypothetical telomeric sfiI 20 protein 3 [Streptomyces laurentii]
MAFEERHDGGEAAEDLALFGGLDEFDEGGAGFSLFAFGAVAAGEGLGGFAQAFDDGGGVDVGGGEEALDLALEVVAQPGTAVNWVRWVSSWRQTQRRKSRGVTSSSRSTWTMLGATSSSRPPPPAAAGRSRVAGAKVSYWPRMREARKDRSMPSSTPVTLPPTALRTAPPGVPERRSRILSSSGVRSSRKPATLALTQPARSTTRTGVSSGSWPSGIIRV